MGIDDCRRPLQRPKRKEEGAKSRGAAPGGESTEQMQPPAALVVFNTVLTEAKKAVSWRWLRKRSREAAVVGGGGQAERGEPPRLRGRRDLC